MRPITKILIKKYALKKLKFDFMGYEFERMNELSFHHLIIPRCDSKKLGYGEGYLPWNGAILRQDTAHDYLHIIENIDRDRFDAISSEMVDENIKGYIDEENLDYIDDVLCSFEREYCSKTDCKGKPLIKEEYTRRKTKNSL